MKGFILNSIKAILVLSVALVVFEQIGPTIAGEYFTLIWWGIIFLTLIVAVFIGWRFWIGIESGQLLYDDPND